MPHRALIALLLTTLAAQERLFGPEHPVTLDAQNGLARWGSKVRRRRQVK